MPGEPTPGAVARPESGPETRRRDWRRPAELVAGVGVVAVCAAFVFAELQPALVLRDTTANGGDTGAHVWWPAFFSDHVFPGLRLSGWAPDWYAGFPVGHFYFPLPAILVWVLDLALPYNVAFKLVTALGPVLLPVGAFVLARGLRAPWPAPLLFPAAAVVFLFDLKYQNYGGNLTSTLQGEFSLSIGLALGLCFLGAYARALRERRGYALAAALLGVTLLCHVIVAVFAVGAALVVWCCSRPLRSFVPALAVGVVGVMLTAVWSLPLVARLGYTTDMGWQKLTSYVEHLFPSEILWVVGLAGVGAVAGVVLVRRVSLVLLGTTVLFAFLFVVLWEGPLWNARLLPFYYVSLFLLAAQGLTEIVRAAARATAMLWERTAVPLGTRRDPGLEDGGGERGDEPPPRVDDPGAAEPGAAEPGAESEVLVEPERRALDPADVVRVGWGTATGLALVALIGALSWAHVDRDFLDDWARWNSSGYEARAAYDEYAEIVETMDGLEPGRAVWERNEGLNAYGTDLALELLPYWTDGRIGSMEGLYFESSATTPFHFLMVAKLGSEPSNPVRFDEDSGITYGNLEDFDHGVVQLQRFGVRYLMLTSSAAQARADEHRDLELVATVEDRDGAAPSGWRVYEVSDAPLVESLDYEPVVLEGIGPDDWLEPAARWWEDPQALVRPLAADGPESWVRAAPEEAAAAPFEALPEVEVTDVRTDVDEISFEVSEIGVPVAVKTSYFPGWDATGAAGPWRLTPNLMVVVPTSDEVTLRYGATGVDRAGLAVTALGLVGLVGLAWWGRRRGRRRPAFDARDTSV